MNLRQCAILLPLTAAVMISCSAPESGSTTPSLKSLEIPFIESAIIVDGRLDEAGWRSAATADPFEFSWWKEGKKEGTRAKLLWDNDFLYVSFVCEDAHIWAEHGTNWTHR